MRLRARWRLQTSLVGVAVVAAIMALVIEPRRRRAAQERAIAAVEKLDGLVGLRAGTCLVDSTRRPVHDLAFFNPDVTDADLAHVTMLTELETLDLSGTQITDAGLAQLEGLTNLERLSLGETRITDAGLAHLRGMLKLESLDVVGTEVVGPGLDHLKGLTRLRSLNLGSDRITDAGLAHIAGLTNFESLFLSGAVTDAGLAHLKGLTRLNDLRLDCPGITDAALIHMKGRMAMRDRFVICIRGREPRIDPADLEQLEWNATHKDGAGLIQPPGTPTSIPPTSAAPGSPARDGGP